MRLRWVEGCSPKEEVGARDYMKRKSKVPQKVKIQKVRERRAPTSPPTTPLFKSRKLFMASVQIPVFVSQHPIATL